MDAFLVAGDFAQAFGCAPCFSIFDVTKLYYAMVYLDGRGFGFRFDGMLLCAFKHSNDWIPIGGPANHPAFAYSAGCISAELTCGAGVPCEEKYPIESMYEEFVFEIVLWSFSEHMCVGTRWLFRTVRERILRDAVDRVYYALADELEEYTLRGIALLIAEYALALEFYADDIADEVMSIMEIGDFQDVLFFAEKVNRRCRK